MKELFTALAKAQSLIKGAKKDSTNPFFKSGYADLESVWETARIPLTSNGLSVIQTTEVLNDKTYLKTWLCHISGESICGVYPLISKDNTPQAMGSAMTYARRYALAAIVGIYQTDDDGNAASQKDLPQAKVKEVVKDYKKPVPCPVDKKTVFEGGQYAKQTIEEVFNIDSKQDFKYAIARAKDLANGLTLPPGGKEYVHLCQYEGAIP